MIKGLRHLAILWMLALMWGFVAKVVITMPGNKATHGGVWLTFVLPTALLIILSEDDDGPR